MTAHPTWSPVSGDTADLLDLIAEQNPATPQEVHEWKFFLSVLEDVAGANGGLIDQNLTRPRLRIHVAAPRIGAFFNRAAREGLIRAEGYTETTRSPSGNGGKPAKSYRWLGTDLPAAPSPAAGRNSEAAVRMGSQAAASVHREGVDHMRGDSSWG